MARRGRRSSEQDATRRNGWRQRVRDSRGIVFSRERVVTANSVSQLLYSASGVGVCCASGDGGDGRL